MYVHKARVKKIQQQEFECKRLLEVQTVPVVTAVSELWFNSPYAM